MSKNSRINSELISRFLTEQIPELIAIYVFGSQIKQTNCADSDIDIAVLTPGYIPASQLWRMSNELANQLNIDVDLLDLRAASTVMQYQIITTGELLYGKTSLLQLFRCFVLSEKTALDSARAKLLSRINQEGCVYGR